MHFTQSVSCKTMKWIKCIFNGHYCRVCTCWPDQETIWTNSNWRSLWNSSCEDTTRKKQPGLSTCGSCKTPVLWAAQLLKSVMRLEDVCWALCTFFLPTHPSWITSISNTGCWTDRRTDGQPCHLSQLVIAEQSSRRLLFAALRVSHTTRPLAHLTSSVGLQTK